MKLNNKPLKITCDGGAATVSPLVQNLLQKNINLRFYQADYL